MSIYLSIYLSRLGKIKQWVDAHGGEPMVPFCGALESKLVGMTPEEAKAYSEENKTATAIPKIISTGYHAIDLVHFFTAGSDEVKCWTIRVCTSNTKTPNYQP